MDKSKLFVRVIDERKTRITELHNFQLNIFSWM